MTQTLQQYADSSPSFGMSSDLDGSLNWLVLLCRTRDSGMLEKSNFSAALRSLGGESDTLQIVRFRHWAVGWVEHILLHPSREAEAVEIESTLDQYPVLDEDDLSRRELESVLPAWEVYGQREWAEMVCTACDVAPDSPIRDFLAEARADETLEWHEARGEASGMEFDDSGPTFDFQYADSCYAHFPTYITRDELAGLVRRLRGSRGTNLSA